MALGGTFMRTIIDTPDESFKKNDVFVLFFVALSFFEIFTGFFWGPGYSAVLEGRGRDVQNRLLHGPRHLFFIGKIKYHPKSKYIKRVLHAHALHHQQITAHKGICFGFLYASKKYAVTAENPVST